MNKAITLLCCSIIIGTGVVVYADTLSSVISCDGAIWVSSSVIGETETYAVGFFTTDLATLLTDLDVGKNRKISTNTEINSSGSLGIDEYSEKVTETRGKLPECLFIPENNSTFRRDKTSYTGLMQTGTYISGRLVDKETVAKTGLNGTGLLLSRAISEDENLTETHSSDVAGNMSLMEVFRLGAEDEP